MRRGKKRLAFVLSVLMILSVILPNGVTAADMETNANETQGTENTGEDIAKAASEEMTESAESESGTDEEKSETGTEAEETTEKISEEDSEKMTEESSEETQTELESETEETASQTEESAAGQVPEETAPVQTESETIEESQTEALETEEESVYLGEGEAVQADLDDDGFDEDAVAYVKGLFQALLDDYFTGIYHYDLSGEDAKEFVSETAMAMDWDVLNACYEQLKEAKDSFGQLGEKEAAYLADTQEGLCHVILTTISDVFSELISDNGTMPSSLLPIEERKAYLVVSEEEHINAMPLSKVLELLRDADGNKIEIPQGATTVWTYYKDESGNIIRDEYHVLKNNDTVDLSLAAGVENYRIEMIIGSGKQLDPTNIRYIVKVYVTPEISEKIGYELYEQGADGSRTKVSPARVDTSVNNQAGLPAEMTVYSVPGHVEGKQYYLGISSQADEHPKVKTEVYTLDGYEEYTNGIADNPITSQILDQDMRQAGAGYLHTYDDGEVFVLVHKDQETGQELKDSSQYIIFYIKSDISYVTGNIYRYEGSQMKNIVRFSADSYTADLDSWNVDDGTGAVSGTGVTGLYYMLNSDCAPEGEYYCALDVHWAGSEDNANSYVVKAVAGLYNSLDAAAGQADIKGQLFPADKSSAPYGYKANYYYKNGGQYFTVFFKDGTAIKLNVRIADYESRYDENYVKEFTDAPIVGEQDPWFRVTGANQNGSPLDTYAVENGKEINMDTMYGYGYQTIFINDMNADLSKLQPIFWTPNPDRIKVRVVSNAGQDVVSGVTVTDFSQGAVQYKVEIDGKEKNYQVNFVKKASGSQLYVAGPRKQEVFLDEYFEYKHDILIANLGDQPLTGLKVELNATNTKLDDYWVIGGEGNNTLAPFTATSSEAEYGELANIAKICLRPDGEGEIEGTLKISADGQEPVVIELTGRAQNPKIVTEKLDDAVKFVPYSYWIFTNNMYDWTEVKYTLTEKLPAGMEWRPEIGEIYGVPQETGTFPLHIEAVFTSDTYTFDPSGVDLILTVKENTNSNVYSASDVNYTILDSIGTDSTGTHDYVINEEETAEDQLFRSSGEFGNFVDLWLNGNKLTEGTDYTAESGSTKITIRSQTLRNKVNRSGENTLAAEFRETGSDKSTLKRTAQNFRINIKTETERPTEKPEETDPPSTEPSTEKNSKTPEETDSPETEKLTEESEDLTEADTTDESETTSELLAKKQVNMRLRITDENDAAMAAVSVELHSTPQTVVTDENGIAQFNNVEFGTHTITVKDSSGNIIASKNIQISEGTALNLSGDVITAQKDTSFALEIRVQNGEILLESVSIVSPRTGDTTDIEKWFLLAAASLFVMISVTYTYKKRKRV